MNKERKDETQDCESKESEEKPRTPSSPIARSAAVDVEDSKWRVVLNLVAVGLTFYLLQRVAKEFEKSGKLVDLDLLLYLIGGRKLFYVIGINGIGLTIAQMTWVLTRAIISTKRTGLRVMIHTAVVLTHVSLLAIPTIVLWKFIPDYSAVHGAGVSMQMVIIVLKCHSYFTMRKLAIQRRGQKGGERLTAEWIDFFEFL